MKSKWPATKNNVWLLAFGSAAAAAGGLLYVYMAQFHPKEVHLEMKPSADHGFEKTLTLETLRKGLKDFANKRNWNQYHTPRNLLCALVGEVGELSEIFQWRGEVALGCPGWSIKDKKHLGEEMSDVLLYLIRMADRCHVDLPKAALTKMVQNAAKYPADQVWGSSKKYNEYAHKVAQQCGDDQLSTYSGFEKTLTLDNLRKALVDFASKRNWNQYHTPRNLLCALVGEVGELSEIFQWRGEVALGCPGWSIKDKKHLGEEMSDVLLYLIRMADRCYVDLPKAVLAKMAQNAAKYPADQVWGSSKKYSEYTRKGSGK